jgi:hypothetical protein
MKFVAKTSIHNAPELALPIDKSTPNFQDKLHVPKGHKFEIAKDAKSLKGVTNQAEKQLISKLVMFDLVVVDDDSPESKDAITKINEEVKNEIATAAAFEKQQQANKPLTIEGLLKALTDLGLTAKK